MRRFALKTRAKFKAFSGARLSFALLLLSLVVFPVQSLFAQSPSKDNSSSELIYGPEWTFTTPELIKTARDYGRNANETRGIYREKVNLHFLEFCQKTNKCRIESIAGSDDISLITSFGTTLRIGTDPGVFEVQGTPRTLEQWRSEADYYQEVIFDNFKKVGLKPHSREGAGHLNIGLRYFEAKTLLLRNFIIDFYNHPGVGVVLNSLTANAEDAGYLDQWFPRKQSQDYHFKSPEEIYEMEKSKLQKFDDLSVKSFNDLITAVSGYTTGKWVALGLRDIKNASLHAASVIAAIDRSSRLEIRALRPQASMKDFIKVIEIFEARIQHLSHKSSPIPLAHPEPMTDGWKALGEFADYLSESGLNYKQYKSLMPPGWRNLPEAQFIRKSAGGASALCRKVLE